MADAGHKATDKLLKKLEKDIAAEYKIAVNDMEAKLTAYLEKTEAQRKVQEGMLNAGKITQKEYSDWCYRHNMVGNRWISMCDTLAEDMTHANEIAKGIMEQRMPDVFALNANYATWQIESQGIDTGFTLYNHDTAAYLLGDQRQLMPKPSPRKAALIAANPDMQWNKQKIQSAVLQGVLQGESASEVAQRLQGVGQMNYNSAVRYARTMTTSAQNAGRYEAYRRAKRLGVDLTIEWEAILDHHTRHAHRQMHGQRTEVDKPFHTPDGYTIYYPADCTGASTAPQKEIWNCRCTLLSWVKGYEGDTVKESPALKDMSFEEWQNEKKEKAAPVEMPAAAPAAAPAAETFSSKINAIKDEIKAAGGEATEEQLMRAGGYMADEYDAMVEETQRLMEENVAPLEREYREAEAAFQQFRKEDDRLIVEGKLKYGDPLYEERFKERDRLGMEAIRKKDAWQKAKKAYAMNADSNALWLSQKIGEVREVGYTGIDLSKHLTGDASIAKRVQYGYSLYPKDWVRRSVATSKLKLSSVTRGYYRDGTYFSEIALSSARNGDSVVIHELGHRFERVVPQTSKMERAFYNRRTAGCSLEWLGKGYDKTEMTRKDNFIDKYMGKYYDGKAFELNSMGFQMAYTEPERLAKDPEFQKWIYGQLLLL